MKVTHFKLRLPGRLDRDYIFLSLERPTRNIVLRAPVRSCRVCGCTEAEACLVDGEPCHWVAEDLCSACAFDYDDIFEEIENVRNARKAP